MPRRRFLLAGVAGAAAVAVPAVVLSTRDSDATGRSGKAGGGRIRDRILTGHGAVVSQVAFTPDGTALASGGADGPIMLWDVETGEPIRTLRGHAYPVVAMAFSPDGKTMYSAAEGVQVWDVAAGRALRGLPTRERSDQPREFFAMAGSPDGRYLATDAPDGGGPILWDAATGRLVRRYAGDADASLAFTPDGRTLAGGGQSLRLWDVASGGFLRGFHWAGTPVHSVALGRDGRVLAASSVRAPVRLWDRSTGRTLHDLTGQGNVSGPLAFSPDGRLLAVSAVPDAAGANEITLWDVASGEVNRVLEGHAGGVNALAFHPGGTVLASASDDRTVRLWKLTA
ncbi:WD40 repeat domain-containing protein [Spirillospora sp. NPDC052242]